MQKSNGKYRKQCVRYNIPRHAHELTFSCYKGLKLLAPESTIGTTNSSESGGTPKLAWGCSEMACRFLADAIIKAREKHKFSIWAYVFMPEHAHLLLIPNKKIYSISDILLSIKQPVSRRILNYLRKTFPESLIYLATGQKDTKYRFWQDGGG